MAQRCLFFDSVAGDRSYDATSFAALVRALTQRDGVVYNYGGGLQVAAREPAAMSVSVATGAAFAQGRLLEVHTAAEILGIGAADPTNPRIDRVVVRLDNSAGVRSVVLAVKAGTPAASPSPPVLHRDGTVWELSLAQVYVAAGATSITAGNITDERATASVCDYTFDTLRQADLPAGAVELFAMSSAPTGWLECDGSAVSRTTYARLFTAIGTTFGSGDGSTTFNLPDLRGEFVRGWDHGRGIDTGRGFGSLQLDAFQGHHHRFAYQNSVAGGALGVAGRGDTLAGTRDNIVIEPISDGVNGTPRTASETRPRNIALMYCIKY